MSGSTYDTMSGSAYDSYGRFIAEGPYAGYVQEQRTAGGAPLHLTRLAQPAGTFPDPAAPDLVVQLVTRGEGAASCDLGAGRFRTRSRAGDFYLAPPDTACDYALSAPHAVLSLSLPVAALHSALDGVPGAPAAALAGDFGPLHARSLRDPTVEQICLRLWDEAEACNPYGALFADGAVLSLVAALLRLSGQPHRPEPHKGGLAPRQLRRALECMDAHLAEDVTLAQLAAAAGVSAGHFGHAFRDAVGEPPGRHLMRLRLERARALALRGELPLAQIAAACGFADQAHMTRAFRRHLGTTPGALRRGRAA